MDFRKWVTSSSFTQARVARELAVSESHVSRLLSGKARPSAALRDRIYWLTAGQVDHLSWSDTESRRPKK